jgi:GR25 family glycosyltransferase involved in LPS biosynthesis
MNIENVKNILQDIPIFWINLERALERRNKMNELFLQYDLQAERIDAIDGNNINLDEYKQNYNLNSRMSKYEIACTLSHLKAIKTCYEKNLDYALILEDDITFDYFDYKKDTLKFLLEELGKVNGECIQLCNIVNKKIFSNYATSEKLLIKSDLDGAAAYLITKNGMKKVLDNIENNKVIDISEHMIFRITNNYIVKPYFSYPFLRDEQGNKTNISFIRENTKGAHATQTISKLLWDEYYLTQKIN